MTDDEQAIRDLVDEWMAASKRHDTDVVLGLMTDDVVFMVPGAEPFGKEAFAAGAAKMKDVSFDGRSEIREIEVVGDWAYTRNFIEVEMTMPDGSSSQRSGWTLTVLRRSADKRWRIARDANLMAAINPHQQR